MSRPHVVVIGGGLAGLAAAIEAGDLGARVTLLERRPRLGGATWSFERNGRYYDNGQHVFLRCCTAYRGFLERIGAVNDVILQPRLRLPVVGADGTMTLLARDAGRPPLHLARSVLAYRHLSWRERLSVARAATALARLDRHDPACDRSTFAEWLLAHGQSDRAIDNFWDLVVRPTVNLPSRTASLAVAATVFQIGLLSDGPNADMGWSRVPLSELHAEPAARVLNQQGASVHRGQGANSIDLTPTTATVNTDAGPIDSDAVIVAVPHDRVADLLPPESVPRQDRLASLGWSPIVNVHLSFDRAVVPYPLAAVLDPLVQFVFDRTDPASGAPGQQIAVSLSAADEALARPSRPLIDDVVAALGRAFPAAQSATLVDSLVTREPHATFRAEPGSHALRTGVTTAHPNLFLAGAWTDTGWPATMEGAVRSGVAAAHAALQHARPARALQAVGQ